jgi:cell wall-associated NlpC family hydrolase
MGRRRRAALALCAVVACAAVAVAVLGGGDSGSSAGRSKALSASAGSVSPGAVRDSEESQGHPEPASSGGGPLAESPGQAATAAAAAQEDAGPSPGAPSDAEVRRELRQLQRYKRQARNGGSLETGAGGQANAPLGAPPEVQDVVAGGNAIATFPYRLGGGHGSFVDDSYDCSGSVSYALAAAGMLDSPLTSGDLMKWGVPGRGRWLTVYANPGHVFMTVAGLRFDTSGRSGRRGSRWQALQRPAAGFVARHWPGL